VAVQPRAVPRRGPEGGPPAVDEAVAPAHRADPPWAPCYPEGVHVHPLVARQGVGGPPAAWRRLRPPRELA
jgi:hypothetical protein